MGVCFMAQLETANFWWFFSGYFTVSSCVAPTCPDFFVGKIYNCFCWHFNQTNIFKFCGSNCLIKEETRATFSGFQLEHTEAIKEESNVMNVCSGLRIRKQCSCFCSGFRTHPTRSLRPFGQRQSLFGDLVWAVPPILSFTRVCGRHIELVQGCSSPL